MPDLLAVALFDDDADLHIAPQVPVVRFVLRGIVEDPYRLRVASPPYREYDPLVVIVQFLHLVEVQEGLERPVFGGRVRVGSLADVHRLRRERRNEIFPGGCEPRQASELSAVVLEPHQVPTLVRTAPDHVDVGDPHKAFIAHHDPEDVVSPGGFTKDPDGILVVELPPIRGRWILRRHPEGPVGPGREDAG